MQYTAAVRLRGRHIIYSFVPGPIGCVFGGSIDGVGGSKSFWLELQLEKKPHITKDTHTIDAAIVILWTTTEEWLN